MRPLPPEPPPAPEGSKHTMGMPPQSVMLADAMPQIVWTVGADGRVNYLNRRWLEYTGLSLEESLADPASAVHPDDRPAAEAVWAAGFTQAMPFEYELRLRRSDGVYCWHLARCMPVLAADGSVQSWVGTSTDIHERKEAGARAERLQELTRQLSAALTPQDVAKAVLEGGLAALGAKAGTVVLLEGATLRVAGTIGYGPPVWEAWSGFSLESPAPLATAMREQRAVWLESLGEFAQAYPAGVAAVQSSGSQAWAAAPLLVNGRLVGGLGVSYSEPQRFSESEQTFILTLAELCAQALERSRLYEELHESDTRFRWLSEATPHMVWTFDAEGRLTYVNPYFTRFSGLTLEQAASGEVNIIHPDDIATFIAAGERSKQEQSVFQVEVRIRQAANGEYRWFLHSAVPLQENGQLMGWYGTSTDIHDRRQAEDRLRLALEAGQMGVWDWDVEADTQVWSTEQERLLGLKPGRGTYSGEDFYRLVHPDDQARMRERAFAEGQEYVEDEFRVVRPSGELVWLAVRARLYRDAAGRVVRLTGVNMDITERKRAEETVRYQARLLDAVDQAVIATDLEGRIVHWNRYAEHLYGWKPEEVLGRLVQEVIPAEASRGQAQAVMTVLRQGQGWAGEFLVQHKSGRAFPAMVTDSPIRDTLGRQVGIVGVSFDLSERKQAEEALRQSEEKYRALAEAQKRFVNDAAHELRAPLTAIQGNLELLTRFKGMKKPDREAALEDVAKEAARLGRLVNDMLALARGDSGVGLRKAELRLDRVLAEAFEAAQGLASRHRLALGTLPEVRLSGDRDRLKQLAFQLLENALKYTPAGGRVTLELHREGAWAEFRVSDTGIGIAAEELPRVFERFYRSDKARLRGEDPGGTGLGLSIAQQIVEAHGGRVWLESELGKGTVAVVRLPLAEAGTPNQADQ